MIKSKRIICKRIIGISVCVGVVFLYFLTMVLAKSVTRSVFKDEYSLMALTFKEMLYALSALAMGAVLGRSPMKILSMPHSSHKRKVTLRIILAMTVAYFPMIIIVNVIMQQFDQMTLKIRPMNEIICFVILMLLIGIAEETMFRGIVATSMKNIWGKNKGDIASLASGIFFGLFHLVNLSSAETVGVLCQVCSATAAGMIFADLYYFTGTLWPCIVFHAMVDFGGLMGYGLFGIGSVSEIISSYSPIMCIVPSIFIVARAVLIVKKRLGLRKRFIGISRQCI